MPRKSTGNRKRLGTGRTRTGTGRTKTGTGRAKTGTGRAKTGTGRAKRPGTGRTKTAGAPSAGAGGRRQPSSWPVVALVIAALALVGIAIRVATLEPSAALDSGLESTPIAVVTPDAPSEPAIESIERTPVEAPTPVETPAAEEAVEDPVEEAPIEVAPQPETATTWARGRTETATVRRVVDGDTFETTTGRKVRLIGINTPERKSNDPLNEEATQLLRDLVEGKEVTLEFDEEETDQYQRTLAYVHVGDLFVNGEIVRQGLAYCYTWRPNTAHEGEFVTWQKEAREADRGLWSLPAPAPSDVYVADSQGHRFHREDCSRAKGIRGGRRLTFRSRDDAFDLGQNPCGTCKP